MPNVILPNAKRSEIYEQYRTRKKHYIFVEDGYDLVDKQALIDLYEARDCGYLCGMVICPDGRYGISCQLEHAGIANGIASSDVLEQIWQKHGCLPEGNLPFSRSFIDVGSSLEEYIDSGEYRSVCSNNKVYGNKNGKDIFMPSQVNESKFVYYTKTDRPGSITTFLKDRYL